MSSNVRRWHFEPSHTCPNEEEGRNSIYVLYCKKKENETQSLIVTSCQVPNSEQSGTTSNLSPPSRFTKLIPMQTAFYKCDGHRRRCSIAPTTNPVRRTLRVFGVTAQHIVRITTAERAILLVPATFPLHKHEAWACTFFFSRLQSSLGPASLPSVPIRCPIKGPWPELQTVSRANRGTPLHEGTFLSFDYSITCSSGKNLYNMM